MRNAIVILPLAASASASAALITSTWVGGPTGSWNIGTNWSPVGIPNNAANTYDVIVDGTASSVAVTVNVPPVIESLTVGLGDTVTIPNGMYLGASGGTIVNDGEIVLDSMGLSTELRAYGVFPVNLTFSGTGTLRMSDAPQNWLRPYGGGTTLITNAADHTIEGSGYVGASPGVFSNLFNNGLIDANQSTPLFVRIFPIGGLGNNNSGILRASNGGTLVLHESSFQNTGGLITALPGSTVALSNASIVGGQLTAPAGAGGGGMVHVPSGASGIYDVTVADMLLIDEGATLVFGAVTNNGMIVLDGGAMPSTSTNFKTGNFGILQGTGTLATSDSPNNRIWGPTGITLQHFAPHAIRGAGQLGLDLIYINNRSVIEATLSSGLVLDLLDEPPGQPNAYYSLNHLGGKLRATSGATLTIQDTRLNNEGGFIEADATSFVDLVGTTGFLSGILDDIDGPSGPGAVTNFGTCRLDGSKILGAFDTADGATTVLVNTSPGLQAWIAGELRLNSAGANPGVFTDLAIEGNVTLASGGAVVMSNALTNRIRAVGTGLPIPVLTNAAGNTIRGAGQIGVDGLTIVNAGSIIADTSKGITIDPPMAGSFTNQATGLVRATLGDVRISAGGFSTFGTVIVDPNRLIRRTGNYDQANAGSLTKANGRLIVDGGGVFNLMAGTLSGTFRVEAANVFNTGGTVAPGDAPGVAGGILDIKGNYIQSGPARLKIAITGPPTPNSGNWSMLRVLPGGVATLGGTLEVVLSGPYLPPAGTKFTILTAPSGFTGTFSNVSAPAGMTVIYDPAQKYVQVKF